MCNYSILTPILLTCNGWYRLKVSTSLPCHGCQWPLLGNPGLVQAGIRHWVSQGRPKQMCSMDSLFKCTSEVHHYLGPIRDYGSLFKLHWTSKLFSLHQSLLICIYLNYKYSPGSLGWVLNHVRKVTNSLNIPKIILSETDNFSGCSTPLGSRLSEFGETSTW
jgi:hypothetical protein